MFNAAHLALIVGNRRASQMRKLQSQPGPSPCPREQLQYTDQLLLFEDSVYGRI